MISEPQLIVVRGPAGAGKSTTANSVVAHLRSLPDCGPIAILEQDYFNNIIAGRQSGYRNVVINMLLQNGLALKAANYSLIIEGVLNVTHFKDIIDQLITAYGASNSSIYFFDVSLDETKVRHSTRSKALEFSESLLDEWYAAATPFGYPGEVLLAESLSAEESKQIIIADFFEKRR